MSDFQIFTEKEIEHLRRAGSILRQCLEETGKRAQPGVFTKDLDLFAEDFIRSHKGATPAFKGYHNYPATLCTSVNEQCVHGIPGGYKLKDGDIVSIDCGVICNGLYTDACVTVAVGNVPFSVQEFLRTTMVALEDACAVVSPGAHIGDISATIHDVVQEAGFSCVKGLTGHGLGTTLHQFPDVPNVGKRRTGPALPAWTMIAIEPITSMGRPEIKEESDGWTISTADGSLSAHFEHTVLVTDRGQEILA
jgi:methionyl aminopeptidase